MSAQLPQRAPVIAAMPPPRQPKRRRSTPIITVFFWIIIIALAAAGFVYGRKMWPSLFEERQTAREASRYVEVTCGTCKGRKRCVTCAGSGRAKGLNDGRDKKTLGQMNCSTCKGTRYCQTCGGKGMVQQRIK